MMLVASRPIRQVAALILSIAGVYLIALWFWHFNGLGRMFFGMIGVAAFGLALIIVPIDNGLRVTSAIARIIGWLALTIGSGCAAFLAYFASQGGI